MSDDASTAVTVKVAEPYQVYFDGQTYGPGESVAVPPETAEQWAIHGWIADSDAKRSTGRTAASKPEAEPKAT